MMDDDIFNLCIKEAQKAFDCGDVPIGAAVIHQDKVLVLSHNTREKEHNILGHAEINAILQASQKLKRWNLNDCDLYVTLKPCSMCYEIIKQSRIKNVYYLLDKFSYKKEYDKTSFVKIDSKGEQMYTNLISHFFQNKR